MATGKLGTSESLHVAWLYKTRQEKENVNNPNKKSHKYRLVSHYHGKKVINKPKQTHNLESR